MEKIEFIIPKGYIVDKSESNETKIVYKRIQEKITDSVKTFEDACDIVGVCPNDILQLSKNTYGVALEKIIIIAKALNEGWQPDWNNSNEYKYYPCFKMGSSGFGFSNTFYVNWNTTTAVGSRLCFKNRELAEYAGKQFTDIYKDFLT